MTRVNVLISCNVDCGENHLTWYYYTSLHIILSLSKPYHKSCGGGCPNALVCTRVGAIKIGSKHESTIKGHPAGTLTIMQY
jgi:hypothetical protein